ncbi:MULTISPECIES: fimbria/pilus periplasmic chaperone [Enterobacter]|uniref:fimbria/pilus periplasmic chaperone n=1 Tax=Enterobacter TaxID=547 RepID=UPI001CBAD0B4|nr:MULTISPECIES: fimbria/pilus periplasmic chaperone [Enterobacter]MCK7230263.1 fimbria/pilus periplasmic chaperone [Enterobacter asburiae]UAN39940.1 fimbria/pilus periplasmic chaperone [Enterobacter sp. JBIWA008]UXP24936.1 fimbria/pilus periplasmic chaperone [Enterobacter sp. 155105]
MRMKLTLSAVTLIILAQQAHAAIALDRTRVIYNGAQNSLSLNITNQNKALPYLAQSWIEDEKGNKIESPITALPPLQRVEPGAKGQVKIQTTGALDVLPKDRESLFYFNVREIPPKSDKPNTLQLALQTRVKMFYRPQGIEIPRGDDNEAQKRLTLSRQGDSYQINNPTPYYVTIVAASTSPKGANLTSFKPIMIAPKSSSSLGVSASALGSQPVLTFINDFGGRPQLNFSCSGNTCSVSSVKAG